MASTSRGKKSEAFESDQAPRSSVYPKAQKKDDNTVRDEKGRQRFHGAFTGGFSAGYFNTAGSVEGFQPKKFISKKDRNPNDDSTEDGSDKRQPKFTQRPEDYMDEEDFNEFGIVPNGSREAGFGMGPRFEFAGLRGPQTDSRARGTVTDAITDLLRPVRLSVGEKLLKKMKYNSQNRRIDITGDGPPSSFTSSADPDRDIVEEVSYKEKNDRHGLGFRRMSKALDSMVLTRMAPVEATLQGGQRIKISGEAFGVGALDDDDDNYATFDTNIYGEDEIDNYDFGNQILSKKDRKSMKKHDDLVKPGMNDVIEGFVKAKQNPQIEINSRLLERYPRPIIPQDWKPPSAKSKFAELRGYTSDDVVNERHHRQGSPPIISNRHSVDEKQEEMHQGKKDVQNEEVFKKPLTGLLASKFVLSSQKSGLLEQGLKAGLTQYSELEINHIKPSDTPETSSVDKSAESTKPPCKIVRVSLEWHPSNILCKRFNVPNPFPDSNIIGIVESQIPNQPSLSGLMSHHQTVLKKPRPPISDDQAHISGEMSQTDPDLVMPLDILKSVFDSPPHETPSSPKCDSSTIDNGSTFRLKIESVPINSREEDSHSMIEDVEIVKVDTKSQPVIVLISSTSSSASDDSSDAYGPRLPPSLSRSSERTHKEMRHEKRDRHRDDSTSSDSDGKRKKSKRKRKKKKKKSKKHKKHKS